MPRNSDYHHAVIIDKKNDNHIWVDCIKLEIDQQYQHDTHKDIDKNQALKGHKNV